jgi:ABC-type phosphate/phosphonate transport system ATPase subunit
VIYTFQKDGEQGARHFPSFFFHTLAGWQVHSMENFLFSVPSGEAVSLEPFHYAIIGQTQFSGKTTLIKRLSDWVVEQGYQVLIFDTKETEAERARQWQLLMTHSNITRKQFA